MMSDSAFPNLQQHGYMSLTTFRKSGKAVPTPVWFVDVGDRLLMTSQVHTGKIKRIRTNPQVTVAPCTARGDVLGDAVTGQARILPEADHAQAKAALKRKYGWQWTLYGLLGRLRGGDQPRTYIEIIPASM